MSTCADCRWLLREDYGYSNWTVMGCTLTCLRSANALMPIDDGDATSEAVGAALDVGAACPEFSAGDGPWFDCDREMTVDECSADADVREAVAALFAVR